jgi:hypothetical protein
MEKQVNALIGDLEKVKQKAKTTLTEAPGLADMVGLQLDKTINLMKQKASGSPETGETFGTVTKLKGQDFTPGEKAKPKLPEKVKSADEIAAEELKEKVDALEPLFTKIESDKILDEHSELVIRGIAKRAGLPVTEDNPKKIDVKYVDEIKKALTEKQ